MWLAFLLSIPSSLINARSETSSTLVQWLSAGTVAVMTTVIALGPI
jgi:hypothetical protein